MSSCKSSWVARSRSSSTPWGSETTWTSTATNVVKTLSLAKGKRNSFKYNVNKDEMLICGFGKVKAYFGDEDLISKSLGDLKTDVLTPGAALVVQSGCPYRLEALEDSIILEVSSLHSGQTVRLHDDFQRSTIKLNTFMINLVKKWFLS